LITLAVSQLLRIQAWRNYNVDAQKVSGVRFLAGHTANLRLHTGVPLHFAVAASLISITLRA